MFQALGDGSTVPSSGYHKLMESEVIELINIADVRGADLVNSIVIFDEAQNANPFQTRTLGTRLGENTKLMVLGDPTQIDSAYLDKYSNALINLHINATQVPKALHRSDLPDSDGAKLYFKVVRGDYSGPCPGEIVGPRLSEQ